MNALHFSYSFKLWTNACNCELPTLWLPVPRLHQPGLSNGITVSLHGSLPATDEKLIPLHVRLLSLFHPCEGCDCCHGVRLEISILWPKFCHPEHTQEKKKSENSHYSVKKKKRKEKNQGYHDTDIYKTQVRKCCVVLGGKASAGGVLLLSQASA